MAPTITSGVVDPNIDKYGTYARASALADYLEVAALTGKRVTRDHLRDMVDEFGWTHKPRRQFYTEDPEDDPDTWEEAVYAVIAERSDILGQLYPFALKGNALRLRDSAPDPVEDSYLAVLAIAVVHAWSLTCAQAPDERLESIVTEVMESLGMAAVGMGTLDRAPGASFADTLQRGGRTLGLRPHPSPTPVSRRAKDAGVDTLAGVLFPDSRRAGQWVFIGQSTVSTSDRWERKLTEPKGARWAGYLQEPLYPQAFLAIPYHVEREHLHYLLESRLGLILDRLRLAMFKPANTDEDRDFVRSILAAEVE